MESKRWDYKAKGVMKKPMNETGLDNHPRHRPYLKPIGLFADSYSPPSHEKLEHISKS